MNRHQRRQHTKKSSSASGNLPEKINLLMMQATQQQNARQFAAAAETYRALLALMPEHADANNNLGCILEILGDTAGALACYQKAIAGNPMHAQAYGNLGSLMLRHGKRDEALACYNRSLSIKPNNPEGHNNLGVLLQEAGRYAEALAHFDQAIALKRGYAEAHVNRGNALQYLKCYDEALASYTKAMVFLPDNPELLNNYGTVLRVLRRYEQALASFDKALALRPDYMQAHNNRGIVFQELLRHDDAIASFNQALALNQDYAEAYNNRGISLQELKSYDEAVADYRKAIAIRPDYPDAWNNLGITLLSQGDMAGAEAAFKRALEISPRYANPLYGLTSMRKYSDADGEDVATIRRLLDHPDTAPADKEYFHYALGKIYDDCGRFDDAFDHYSRGNRLRNASANYQPQTIEDEVSATMASFTREFLAGRFAFASPSTQPLFIVGMPRSGTTLLASILSNHRDVESAGELLAIMQFATRLAGVAAKPYPQALTSLPAERAAQMIREYEMRLRADVCPDVAYIVDKHPLNFRHLGLIAMLFPQARVIHCTRDPLDTCLSNYFQRFNLDYTYSFDLNNIGHYYGQYMRLMKHWEEVLPLSMLPVSYEDTVADTESSVRRMLDFLGLGWDERCLAPHTNPKPIETASKWQVRQPIYRQSLQRWKHYDKHLAGLKQMLTIAT